MAEGPLEDDEIDPNAGQRRVVESESELLSVDAGAGTGKTTTMVLRIERAIESGVVDPEDVLVLTFANEAAANIRRDVAERLEPEAAAAIDVYTYHSLCYRLVREYAYYLGLSPDFEVVTDRRRRRLVGRLLAENEYEFAAAPARGDGSTADLADAIDSFIATMSREDVDPETLTSRLPSVRALEMCTEFVLWLEETASTKLTFENESFRYFNDPDHLEDARDALVEYGKRAEFCREKIAEAPEQFRSEPVVRSVDRYLQVLQECVTKTIETLDLEEPTTKHLPRALFGNEIYGEATERIEQTPFGRLQHYLEYLRLARHYADVYAEYRHTLEREGAVDFDELVRTATELLAAPDDGSERESVPSVADGIADQWKQVYCDEFQDTDETQFRLVRALTDGPDRPDLLAIGDKDQAIYGWRGTDRRGLDRVGAGRSEHESVELEVNFRSRQEILELTNECSYGQQSTKTLREDERTPGEYDEQEPPHRVLKVESDRLDRSTPEQVAETVSRLLNGSFENVPQRSLEDVAVIVRTNRHAQAVADELRNRRVPYELSGSPSGDISPGIRTLLSYLRVLVDPEDDRQLRRVLLYRYRIPESDLEALARGGDSLYDSLFDRTLESFEASDRLERARENLRTLESIRDVYPLPEFVRRFREITNLEWYLTGSERIELERIDRFVERYDGDSLLTGLTFSFVDALERTLSGSESTFGRGSQSSDSVDVMTVHQAKGLEFDTVLVPFLSDEEWCVDGDYAERARTELLTATIEDEVDTPLLADLAAEPVGEEWRVFHVALTRAANHLFVFGSEYEYDGDDSQLAAASAQACLADEIEWSVAGKRMDLWSTVRASFETVRERYPETVIDCTDELSGVSSSHPGSIVYYAADGDRRVEPLETREAIETAHRLGRLLRTGSLLPAADARTDPTARREYDVPTRRWASALTPPTTRFPVDTLSSVSTLEATIRHSYSALETHDSCARKHYLDHVVRAPEDSFVDGADGRTDPDDSGIDPADGTRSDRRLVGSVFHAVAEEAFYRGYETRSEWHEAAVRRLTARGALEHRGAVASCIDRYFEVRAPGYDDPIAAWESVGAELPFALENVVDVAGTVVGYIDAVKRTPDGELVVLDYKATAEPIDPADAVQLRLYVRACEKLFDEPVGAAGYVYVGETTAGETVLLEPEALPAWESVRESLESADSPTFAETSPGPHCRYCPHRSLGCAPEEYDVLEE